jgi:hypothetical protein
MTTSEATEKKPLWLSIEEKILAAGAEDLTGGNLEASIKRIAGELDETGYNVSGYGGNLLKLRWAIDDMAKAGKPLLKDVKAAVDALTLEDASDAYAATNKIVSDLGDTWPKLKSAQCRPDVIKMVEQARLTLLIAKAKEISGDEGIRYLIGEKVVDEVIVEALEITDGQLAEVHAAIAAEKAERKRVAGLLEKVADKDKAEQIKHLFDNNVAEALIMEMAEVDQGALDAVKKAMEEEIAEKKRLAEEEAARKKAEAEGPALEDIPADELIDFIDSVREIMEFSDVEKEIRTMCEQSAIPKALVDIAVSDPDKLDELEKQAEG